MNFSNSINNSIRYYKYLYCLKAKTLFSSTILPSFIRTTKLIKKKWKHKHVCTSTPNHVCTKTSISSFVEQVQKLNQIK